MDQELPRNRGLAWPSLVLLFLLPLALGLIFQSDSSGNGDGAAYRSGVCYIEANGAIPLARLDWSHPGHLLAAWGVTRILATLGWAQDPHYAIQLLNLLSIAMLAVVLARTWFLYDPDRPRSLLAGLCVALLPGWAWCAQEPLSDVSGHGLVALCICSLLALQARIRDHRPFLFTAFVASFLAGLAFLFRPSAGLFLPIMLWLGIEALLRAQTRRLPLALVLVLGGLLPIAGVYLHFLAIYGQERIWAVHLPDVAQDMSSRTSSSVLGLIKDWFFRSLRGLGFVAFALSCLGWMLWLLAGDWRQAVRDSDPDHARKPRVALRPALLFTLGLLPYFLFLLCNGAAGRFRFSLPVQLSLVIGIVPLMGHLEGRHRRPWLKPCLLLVAVVTLVHTLTFSYLLSSRHHFVEAGALAVSRLSRPTDLLLGHQAAPYMLLREDYRQLLAGGWGEELLEAKPARTHGIRFDAKADDRDFWNWSWRQAEREILDTHAKSGRVLYINEVGLGGFRDWLALRGFHETSLTSLGAETLRNRMDTSLELMSATLAHQLIDLHVLRVDGPAARLLVEPGDSPVHIRVRARKHPLRKVRLLAGPYSETESTQVLGTTVPMDARLAPPVVLETGTLDDRGEARLGIDPNTRPTGEVWLLLVMDEGGSKILARSQLWFPNPRDDQTPTDVPPWMPPKEELEIR